LSSNKHLSSSRNCPDEADCENKRTALIVQTAICRSANFTNIMPELRQATSLKFFTGVLPYKQFN
jgi:hypothetical protein